MTYNDIINDLKGKKYAPVYLLNGDEPFYIDKISNFIAENVLTETEKGFNQTILYGKETNVPTIDSIIRRYPMMSEKQVVILKEAQTLKDITNLASYCQKPLNSTIFVICYKYKKLDKKTKVYKAINSNGVIFQSDKIREWKIGEWIINYTRNVGLKISDRNAAVLAGFLGTDLSKISNEIKKLKITMPEGKNEITAELIELNIGLSKDFNNFELQDAISKKNIIKANTIVNHFAKNPKVYSIFATLPLLYSFFTKVLIYHSLSDKSDQNVMKSLKVYSSFFLKDYRMAASNYPIAKLFKIMRTLREYDLKAKGVDNISTNQGELMREMVFKLLH